MFSALTAVKFVATTVVGLGTTKIVGKIIKNNVSPETLVDKVTVVAAAWVMGGIAHQATKKYTEQAIDDAWDAGVKIVDKFKLDAKLGRINREESTFLHEELDENDFVYNATEQKWFPATDIKEDLDTKLGRIYRGETTYEEEGLTNVRVRLNDETNQWEQFDIKTGKWNPALYRAN
jgi:hypothetical protein